MNDLLEDCNEEENDDFIVDKEGDDYIIAELVRQHKGDIYD